jgi:hypothetical protein
MKVITLTQPWATLIAIGAKRIETRSWATSYRGPLAIHAAKGLASVGGRRGLHAIVRNRPFCDVMFAPLDCTDSLQVCARLPLGAIVATCDLVAILRTENTPIGVRGETAIVGADGEYHVITMTDEEIAFGDYTPGRYAWLLANVRALPKPIPAKGAQRLWNYEGELL